MYVNALNSGNDQFDQFIISGFVSGSPLRELVKRGNYKGYDKTALVSGFVRLCRLYGYSGMPPIKPSNKPFARDWIAVNNTTEYSASLELYFNDHKIYDELSANHNGLIGYGVIFSQLLNRHKVEQ